MRFAYIDSQGKEVSIPSVEALQLRIELGAITEGTRFYDASTDRWAPAGEHEIFRTLSRESGDRSDGGFVAPPPPTRGQKRPGAPPAGPESPEEGDTEEPSPEAAGASPGEPTEPTESAESAESTEPAESPAPARPRDPDPFEREQGPSEDADDPSLDPFDLDIPVEQPSTAEPSGEQPSAADDFDFEGFGTIELDDAFTAPSDEEPTESAEEVAEAAETPDAADVVENAGDAEDVGDGEEAEGTGDVGSAEDIGDADAPDPVGPEATGAPGMADDLELEPPLSEQAASSFMTEETGATDEPGPDATRSGLGDGNDEPPAWMVEETAEESGSAPGREERDRESQERGSRAPAPPPRRGRGDDDGSGDDGRRRTRPRPPPRRGGESRIGRIAVGLAVGIVLVAGGWYLLALLGDGGEPTRVAEPVVEIPELPAELVSTFEQTGPAAYTATLDSLRALGTELPEVPPGAWLGGDYLANASGFPGVRDYWSAVRGYLDRIRTTGEELFVSLYEAELDSAGVASGGDRDALVDRARAGFQASRPDRRAIYDQLEGLVGAAEGLDDFLRENEASIDYEPVAGGISRDPVVEAVPATEALGEEMWDRMARITAAMDALGTVDRVGSELLLDILFEKLGRTTLY